MHAGTRKHSLGAFCGHLLSRTSRLFCFTMSFIHKNKQNCRFTLLYGFKTWSPTLNGFEESVKNTLCTNCTSKYSEYVKARVSFCKGHSPAQTLQKSNIHRVMHVLLGVGRLMLHITVPYLRTVKMQFLQQAESSMGVNYTNTVHLRRKYASKARN
jgi:hypothetical protein